MARSDFTSTVPGGTLKCQRCGGFSIFSTFKLFQALALYWNRLRANESLLREMTPILLSMFNQREALKDCKLPSIRNFFLTRDKTSRRAGQGRVPFAELM